MDNKIAFFVVSFVKVLVWVDFENIVRHLETDWLHLLGNGIAVLGDMTESLISSAIKVWESILPLSSNLFEYIRWNGKLGATSINDGWVSGILTWLLHWFGTVIHTLALKSPGSEPVLEILESFKSGGSSDDLSGVVSTKESIWGFAHLVRGNRKGNHGSINNTVILKTPKIMKLLLFHVLMG